jgi:K+-transporting ATPase ATPase A chain
VLAVNFVGFVLVYALQRMQGFLPLNPQDFPGVSADSSFDTAISFASNTNWQGYGGETTMSYLTQALALGVQNFLSAATGIAVLVALTRGLIRRESERIGNFWVDFTRTTLYVLLPLSTVLAIVLLSQGVVQSIAPYLTVALLEPLTIETPVVDAQGEHVTEPDGAQVMEKTTVTEQTIPLGPAASQIAIKQLGTNGGGFFNVNSSHPFENPTPLSNFLQVLSILLIPAALCYTFGRMVRDTRQGWALLAAMLAIFVPLMVGAISAEQAGNPALAELGVDQEASTSQSGGNMEGKEVRYGIANSALWATATTAASNGSVNSMHDSFTPLGGLVPMWLMQLGEVVFGGVGSGLYGMLMFAIVAVFIAGLMVGRTPEYLGKKIEAFEMKMASLVLLIPCAVVLIGTAIASVVPVGTNSVANPGPHNGGAESGGARRRRRRLCRQAVWLVGVARPGARGAAAVGTVRRSDGTTMHR